MFYFPKVKKTSYNPLVFFHLYKLYLFYLFPHIWKLKFGEKFLDNKFFFYIKHYFFIFFYLHFLDWKKVCRNEKSELSRKKRNCEMHNNKLLNNKEMFHNFINIPRILRKKATWFALNNFPLPKELDHWLTIIIMQDSTFLSLQFSRDIDIWI